MGDRRAKVFVAEDTNFQVGDTLIVLDVEATLGQAGTRGWVACDGAGNITVEVGTSGGYQTAFTIKQGEAFDLDGLTVGRIRLTHTGTDSAYRIVVA